MLIAKTLMEGALTSVDTRMTFLTAAFYAVCACLRLARYNAEHEEDSSAVDDFSGIPTPGAAGVNSAVSAINSAFNFSQPLATGASLTINVTRVVQAGDPDPRLGHGHVSRDAGLRP